MLAVTSVAQSAVTHPAWSEIQGTLMEQMHAFVSPYKANPSALQILLALCGDAFAQAYFPAERAHRYLLVEPFMSQDTRRELEQQLLSDLLTFLAPHMVNVIQSNAMQRLKEGMTESYARHAAAQPCTTNVDLAAQIAILHLHGHFCTLPLSTPVLPPTASFLTVVAKMPTVSPLDADKTLRSQALADEVNLFRMCHGRSLPMQLRQLLWFRRLYVPDKCTDLRWRLQANQAIMSLTQPWSSSIASLLFRLVRDSLADMPTAAVYAPDQSRLCDTLNLWYVMTKLQSSHFLHLAMPLVHLFPSFDSKDIEIVSCLHVFLNTYHRCAISRSELNAATQRVGFISSMGHPHNVPWFRRSGWKSDGGTQRCSRSLMRYTPTQSWTVPKSPRTFLTHGSRVHLSVSCPTTASTSSGTNACCQVKGGGRASSTFASMCVASSHHNSTMQRRWRDSKQS
ncbi:hypothetical protein, variant [Aphanomyces invadans]|uniref:Uncharacterized protein n=1 Tax=Aphanomyces invadans TaxID=157072 RepID=A0A024UFL2_9STRA|nr:hypothetical protein, variant [Aphanomyces invadans]ETW04975.1 hypothetical protein, variant [Aphanomyces invadans]|eukprot:XP_008866412.1 hypothetical protein, variant [Aphanomyces invadans]